MNGPKRTLPAGRCGIVIVATGWSAWRSDSLPAPERDVRKRIVTRKAEPIGWTNGSPRLVSRSAPRVLLRFGVGAELPLKVAVTARAIDIVSLHAALPVQAPLQPANVAPEA